MSSTLKYLNALEGPEMPPTVVEPTMPVRYTNGVGNGALAENEITELTGNRSLDTAVAVAGKNGEDLDLQFIARERAGPYINFLEQAPTTYNPGFRIFDDGATMDQGKIPLILCEFLAYKSSLSYCKPKRIEQNLRRDHPQGLTRFAYFDSRDHHGHTQGYGFVLDQTAYLVFRGTEFFTWADWATDFDAVSTTRLDPVRYEREKHLIGPREPGRHTGFAIAWGTVRYEVERWVAQVFNDGDARRLVLSGHSLGGALAKLAAYQFASLPNRPYEIGAVVTFGAPLVGTKDFRDAYDKELGLGNRTIRVAASLDLITMLTLAPASFRHVGREWHLDKRPAYSRWRMYFFTPLWDPKEEAKQKSEARQKARPKEPTEQGSWKGFALVLLLRGSWFLVKLLRRAEAAHSVNRSYALYLTVLSYQALRKSLAGDYERSHARLLSHLSYVRGSDGRLFGVAKNGPIPVKSSADEERLQRQFEHFIV